MGLEQTLSQSSFCLKLFLTFWNVFGIGFRCFFYVQETGWTKPVASPGYTKLCTESKKKYI